MIERAQRRLARRSAPSERTERRGSHAPCSADGTPTRSSPGALSRWSAAFRTFAELSVGTFGLAMAVRPLTSAADDVFYCIVKYNGGHRHPQHDLRRPRRSDAAGDPRAARAGERDGHGARGTVRAQPAGDLEAPEGARARWPRHARPRGAVASVPAPRTAAARGSGLDRGLPGALGAAPRPH